MPTAARLVSAILLACLAFFASLQVMPLLPEGTNFGYFIHVNVVLGLLVGWIYMGRRFGGSLVNSINNGVTGAIVLVLCALFLQGAWEMFRLAHRLIYDGPVEAIAAIFTIGLDYFFLIAVPNVWVTLIIGGCLVGLISDMAWKRWR